MKMKFLVLLAALSICVFAGNAAAMLVELTGSETAWSADETLSWSFDSSEVLKSDGTGGSLYIHARGDFFNKTPENYPGQPDKWELIDIDVDMYVIAKDFYLHSTDPGIIVWDPVTDHNEWEYTWAIDPATMLAIAGDESAEVVIDLHMGVMASGLGDFVDFNLSYNAVPIPAAVWLLGSGILGLFGIRRRLRG